jgi:hypothetical protein
LIKINPLADDRRRLLFTPERMRSEPDVYNPRRRAMSAMRKYPCVEVDCIHH